MKRLLLLILFIFSSVAFSGMRNTYEYNKFIKAREKLYKLRNGKYKNISFNVLISESYKNTPFGKLWLKLQKMSKDSNMAPKELRKAKRIITFDYNSKFSPKNMGIGIKDEFYHSLYGLKIHMSCYDLLVKVMAEDVEGSLEGSTQNFIFARHKVEFNHRYDSIENILEDQLARSVNQMTTCGNNYPNIKTYISKWIDSLKNTEFFCDEEVDEESSTMAYSNERYNEVVFTPREFLIMLNKQSREGLDNSEGRSTLIHEVLHLSNIDNNETSTHNRQLKTVAPNCTEKDRLRDRVYFLEHLCSGKKVNPVNSVLNPNKAELSMDELLAKRINQCGMKDGCVDQFSLNDDRAPDTRAAQKFCTNMNEMGKCKMEVKKMLGSNMPRSVIALHEKLADKIINFKNMCDQYPVPLSVRHLCPKFEERIRYSRNIYAEIREVVEDKSRDGVIEFLKNEERIKSLSYIPFVRTFLSESEWKKVLKYYKQYSDVTLTNYCGEKLKLTKQLGKMERLSPAPREMRVCPM